MSAMFIVGVPDTDRDDLTALAQDLNYHNNLIEQRYFDGTNFVEMVFAYPTLSAAAWLTLRTWITTRAERHKSTRITTNGIETIGVSPKDAIRLLEAIQREHDNAQHPDDTPQ